MSKRKHTENQFVTDDCDEQVLIQEILHYFNIWKLKINIQFQAKSYIFLKRLIFEIQRWVQKMQKNYLWKFKYYLSNWKAYSLNFKLYSLKSRTRKIIRYRAKSMNIFEIKSIIFKMQTLFFAEHSLLFRMSLYFLYTILITLHVCVILFMTSPL